MTKYFLITALVLFSLAGGALGAQAESPSLVRVGGLSKAQYLKIARMGLEIRQAGGGRLEFVAWPDDIRKLTDSGIPYETAIGDLTQFYKSRYSPGVSMGGFRTFDEIVYALDSLAALYPGIMTPKFSIGKTIEGRDQWVVKISDNPGVDEDEPEVLYVAMIHAREPVGPATILFFIQYLLSGYGIDPAVTNLVDNRELYFLSVQNPDGYVYNQNHNPSGGGMWRGNRRNNGDGTYGVDLNRNYGYKWGFDGLGSSPTPGDETYRGTAAFSEPETDNVKTFVASRHFVIIHNLHSYSNLAIWPFGYDRVYTTEQDFFVNLGDSLTLYNGYTPEIGWALYPTNGDSDDWGWGDTLTKPRTISMTTEIGRGSDGFWPDPSRIPALVQENVWPNFFLARIADNPYVIAPPKPPTVFSLDSVGQNFTLEWAHRDSINPAVSYRLVEHTNRQTVVDHAESDLGYWDAVRMGLSSTRRHGGAYSWHTLSADGTHHWLLARTPYEVKANDSLKFWTWYAVENGYDYFYAQVSVDGGYTFVNLAGNVTTNNNPYGNNLGNGITGFSGAWVEAKFSLSGFAGQEVIFRLAYFTDGYWLEEGVYLDDIADVAVFGATTEIGAGITDTFYLFSGNANDDYWYQVAATDAQDQEGRLSSIARVHVLAGTPCCVGLRGNANGDPLDKTNVSDVAFLLNYLFGVPPGPAPACREEANANGDPLEKVNISDVTYLVTYLFGIPQGPPPPACP